jgi:hypothetical protein
MTTTIPAGGALPFTNRSALVDAVADCHTERRRPNVADARHRVGPDSAAGRTGPLVAGAHKLFVEIAAGAGRSG